MCSRSAFSVIIRFGVVGIALGTGLGARSAVPSPESEALIRRLLEVTKTSEQHYSYFSKLLTNWSALAEELPPEKGPAIQAFHVALQIRSGMQPKPPESVPYALTTPMIWEFSIYTNAAIKKSVATSSIEVARSWLSTVHNLGAAKVLASSNGTALMKVASFVFDKMRDPERISCYSTNDYLNLLNCGTELVIEWQRLHPAGTTAKTQPGSVVRSPPTDDWSSERTNPVARWFLIVSKERPDLTTNEIRDALVFLQGALMTDLSGLREKRGVKLSEEEVKKVRGIRWKYERFFESEAPNELKQIMQVPSINLRLIEAIIPEASRIGTTGRMESKKLADQLEFLDIRAEAIERMYAFLAGVCAADVKSENFRRLLYCRAQAGAIQKLLVETFPL